VAECLECLLAAGDQQPQPLKGDRRARRQHRRIGRKLAQRERGAEVCVASLLDLSARHTPHFDWVVAHLGSCFPATVVTRVIQVGLREFCSSAETQASKSAGFSLSKVPKLNSVVGILGHLASAHPEEVRKAIREAMEINIKMVSAGQKAEDIASAMDEVEVARIPFLLFLSSLSEPLRRATFATDFLAARMARDGYVDVVAALADGRWRSRYFPESDSLMDLATNLALQSDDDDHHGGLFGLLLEVAGEESNVSQRARNGCRALAERLLCELQVRVRLEMAHSGYVFSRSSCFNVASASTQP